VPGFSNVAFGDQFTNAPSTAFMAVNHFLDSTNNYRNIVLLNINNLLESGSSTIPWATMLTGVSTITYETINQPHVSYRKS
jgi:hypothetical protein